MPVVTFGSATNGTNFDLDFVIIDQWTNPAETEIGYVPYDFGMSKTVITNEMWLKFEEELGLPITGSDPGYGTDLVTEGGTDSACPITWFEAAQFVNWLNTSTGHHETYKFTGTQGTSDYTFDKWSVLEALWDVNLFRHKQGYYYIPSESEWVKAAYWNGTNLQTWATVGDVMPTQAGWNFRCCGEDPCRCGFECSMEHGGWASAQHGSWPVERGAVELNGTYNMMGNIWEWCEAPWDDPLFGLQSPRIQRGGNWNHYHRHSGTAGPHDGKSSSRSSSPPGRDDHTTGFRVSYMAGG